MFHYNRDGVHWTSLSGNETILGQAITGMGVKIFEVDRSIPFNLTLPGDWVLRVGADPDQGMVTLGSIVSGHLKKTVHFEKQTKMVDTIVVRGTFTFKPLETSTNTNERDVLMFRDGKPNPAYPSTIEKMTFAQIFERMEIIENHAVIDESGCAKLSIRVRDAMTQTNESKFLDQLEKQTGLHFEHESRPYGVWSMVDGAASK